MSFLTPSVLWGLLAASIPLIIHLVSQRRTQRVNFSTIRFIKLLEHDAIRKLKLRQWLLLFLRTVAIILLILVFARPVKVGYFPAWAAGDKTTQMIFLLDNSASMNALFDKQSLLERSKRILSEILEGVEGKLLVDIYQTTPFQKRFSGEFISLDQVKGVLSLIHETSGTDNLWEIIKDVLSQTQLESRGLAEVANQEFYIFSDFPSMLPEGWKPGSTYSGDSFPTWRYYLFPQPEIENNLTVASVRVLSQLRLLNHLISVAASVRNQAKELRKNIPVQLYFDNDRVGQVVSDFSPSESKDFVFQAFPNRTGSIYGVVEIPEDNYELDNQKFVQFSIPPKIHCKVVGSSPEELSLLRLALLSITQDSLFVAFDQIPSYSTTTLSLEEVDVLILVDPGKLKPSIVDEIIKFTRRGGNIIAFLGEKFSKEADSSLVRKLFFPSPNGLSILKEEAFHDVTTVKENHPLFLDFPASDLIKEMPRIFSHVRSVKGDRSRTILTLSNGDPLLIEVNTDFLSMLVFTTLPDLQWTDLPIRGFFVPLLHRMLVYLVSDQEETASIEVGETVIIPLRREHISGELEMISPMGRKTMLVPNYRREQVTVGNTEEVGVYRLLSNGIEVASFVANISQTESPTERLHVEKLLHIFPDDLTRLVQWNEDAVTSVVEARRGTELWRLFLIAALGVLVIETWIGRVREEKPTKE